MEEAEDQESDIEDKIMENNEAEKKTEINLLDHEGKQGSHQFHNAR